MAKASDQRGVVSIFTVVMFAILLSIISVGFVRLMIDEQQQTLEDALSKNAYNAAQAGIEDAKRAMLHCNTLSGTAKTQCETQLYNPSCPGFNAPNPAQPGVNAFETIGIPLASSSKTTVGDDETAQGYSCVTVAPVTDDVVGDLRVNKPNDSLIYELNTTAPFDTLTLDWHDQVPTDLKTGFALTTNGNPRKGTGQWGNAPAALRLTLISTLPGLTTLDSSPTTIMNSTFLYPVSSASSPASISFTAPAERNFVHCTNPNPAIGQKYACRATFNVAAGYKHYIVMKPIYQSTTFKLTAKNGLASVKFDNVQPAIDSTGYTSGVFRRVQARVAAGAGIVPHSSSIDAGQGICKDFIVGKASTVFNDSCSY